MLIAQISDVHIREKGAAKTVGVDTNGALSAAIEEVNGFSPMPDVVMITGDLAHSGKSAEYEMLGRLLDRLKVPCYLLLGNHDDRNAFRNVFNRLPYLSQGQTFCQYVLEDYPLRIIALDTTVNDHHHGELCRTRLAWLDDQLQKMPEKPTIIFMHHPPIRVGIDWMDGIGLLSGAAELAEIVRRHPQVQGLHCGHIHRTIQSSLGSTLVGVAPSTCYAVALDLVPQGKVMLVSEPPGLHLHYWDGDRVITHCATLEHADETLNLIPLMPNWELRLELMRQGKGIPKSLSSRHMHP